MYVDILDALAYGGPLKLTHLMHKVNVNYSVLSECLDFLTKQGLVEVKTIAKGRKVCAITQLGVTVIKQFRELKDVLPIFVDTRNEARKQELYLL